MTKRRVLHEWEVSIYGILHRKVWSYDRKGAIEAAIEQSPEHMQHMLRRRKSREFITQDLGREGE